MSRQEKKYHRTSQRDYEQLPKEEKQELLINGFLKYTDSVNGLWVDACPVEENKAHLIHAMRCLLSSELREHKSVESLRLLCASFKKEPGEIAAEYVENRHTSKIGFSALDTNELGPYIDLAAALFCEPYVDTVIREYHTIVAARYPKIEQAVKDYRRCIDTSNKEEGLNQIYRLYGMDDLSDSTMERIMAATVLMGHEAYVTQSRLPFYCLYRTLSTNKINRDEYRSRQYPYVCQLYQNLDQKNLDECFRSLASGAKVNNTHENAVADTFMKAGAIKENRYDLTTDELIASPYFKKYYRNQRRRLCEKIGCSDDELASHLYRPLSGANYDEEMSLLIGLGRDYGIQPAVLQEAHARVIDELNESLTMMEDSVLPIYFLVKLDGRLRKMYNDLGEEAFKNITRRELNQEIGADGIDEDICYLSQYAYFDLLTNAINKEHAMFYRHFRYFEKNTGKSLSMIEMQQTLNKYKNELESARDTILGLKKKSRQPVPKAKNNNEKYFRAELVKANNEIDDLRNQNNELQKTIDELESYIDILDAANITEDEDNISDSSIDEAALRSIRIVFVCGDVDIKCPELRREFPDSTIIETATQNATLKKSTDLVVYFTKHISHSMFFRAKSAYKGVPEYFFNGTNIDKLKCELSEVIRKMNAKGEVSV